MTLVWALAAAWGQGVDPRRAADDADDAGDYTAAVTALRECVATSSDRDRRYCETRLAVLSPQADDDFSGWRVLERVRRQPGLDGEEARAMVRAALDANPTGPAVPHLARWLAHDELRRGAAGATPVAPGDAAWLAEQRALEARQSRHVWIGRAGLALAAGYMAAVAASWLPGKRHRGVPARGLPVVGILVLGVGPLVLATAFDQENLLDFALSGAVAAGCLLGASRCHPAVAGLGTLGAMAWAASTNDWLAPMGIP